MSSKLCPVKCVYSKVSSKQKAVQCTVQNRVPGVSVQDRVPGVSGPLSPLPIVLRVDIRKELLGVLNCSVLHCYSTVIL